MNRYCGQPLKEHPRIAVIANDAIGNFVVGTPLLQMLRTRFPDCTLDYFGGKRTWELVQASDLMYWAYPLHGTEPHQMVSDLASQTYDLVINMEWTPYATTVAAILAGDSGFVCGPSVGKGGRERLPFPDDEQGRLWADQEWIAEAITSKYSILKSGFIGEIFCRLAYLEGDVPRYRLPNAQPTVEIPEVLIATAASLPEKLWTLDKWAFVLGRLAEAGVSVGLLGAPPAQQREFWNGDSLEEVLVQQELCLDLRGALTLPQVVGALDRAKAVLTIDNGILHLACGTETPVVGLFRHGIHRLWAPPNPHLTILTPGPDQLVAEIDANSVLSAVERALEP